jgi:hypothetical protein
MATRFYLPSTGAAAVSPAYDAGWEDTSFAARLKAVTTRISSAFTTVADNVNTKLDEDHLYRQYVSDPIPAQTITAQTIKVQIRAAESNAAANLFTSINIRVVSNDGSTFRTPAVVAMQRDDVEWASTLTNRGWSGTSSAVVASANDRIVIEIGQGGDPTGGGNHNDGTMRIGDNSATDLPEDDTDTNDYNPWVEFAQTLFPTTYYQSNAGAITPSGTLVGKALKKLAGAIATAGTVVTSSLFHKALAGAQTFAGDLAKKAFEALAGAITPSGTVATKVRFTKLLEGAMTFTGTLALKTLKLLAGDVTPTGTVSTSTLFHLALAGAQTFVGDLGKKSFEALVGAITFDGAVSKKNFELLEGAQTFVGTVSKKSFEALSGAMTFAGDLRKKSFEALAGAITFIGDLTPVKQAGIFFQAVAGAITPSGTLVTKGLFKRALAGAMTFSGDLIKRTKILVAGAITPSGILDPLKLGSLFFQSVAGAITFDGGLVPKALKKLYGTITPAGGLSLKTLKKLAGSITPSGILTTLKTNFLSLAGDLTSSGVLATKGLFRQVLAGAMTFAGDIRKKTSITLTGIITPAGNAAKKMFVALAGAVSFLGTLVGSIVETANLELTVETVIEEGIIPTFNTVSGGGNHFLNNGMTWIHVRNGAEDVNITFETFHQVDNHPFVGVPLDVADRVVTVPADTELVIGIFPAWLYSDNIIDNMVQMTYDNKNNVTIAVMTHELYWEA